MTEKEIEQKFKADFRKLFLSLKVKLLFLPLQYSGGIGSRIESSSKVCRYFAARMSTFTFQERRSIGLEAQ